MRQDRVEKLKGSGECGKRSPQETRKEGRGRCCRGQILPEPVIVKPNFNEEYQKKKKKGQRWNREQKQSQTEQKEKVKENGPDLHKKRRGKKRRKKEMAGHGERRERDREEQDGRKKERTSSGRARAAKNDERSRLGGSTGSAASRGPNQKAAWRADRCWLPGVTASCCENLHWDWGIAGVNLEGWIREYSECTGCHCIHSG